MKNIIYREEIPLPIPFMGVPIRYRINPISTLITVDKYEVIIVEDTDAKNIRGNYFEIHEVRKLLELLSRELDEELKIRILIKNPPIKSEIILYSTATYVIGKLLSEEYDVDVVELYESFMGIESEIFGKELPQFIQAMRLTILHGKPLIYRYSEGEIVNENPSQVYLISLKDHKMRKKEYSPLVDDEIVDMVTKLTGINVVKTFNKQRLGDIRSINENCRIENGLWHILYGYSVPEQRSLCSKLVVDIGNPKILELSEKQIEQALNIMI